MKRLADKVVLLSGAAGGIGRATALRLAEEGARLTLLDLDAAALGETAGLAGRAGSEPAAAIADLTDPEAVEGVVASVVAEHGRLDALVNLAGILRFVHAHDISLEAWRRTIDVNLTGTWVACRAALPHLLASRGCIVNAASTAGLRGLPYGADYAASKGGVIALTRSLAVEYGKQGLRANCVCPGTIRTPMVKEPTPEGADVQLMLRHLSLGGAAEPEKVAGVIALLVSDEGSHINGEALRVDGGALA